MKEPPVCENSKTSHGVETILVVEDEDNVRTLTVTMLKRMGYNTLMAASGTEALELCRDDSEPIDLIITDIVMPNLSGRQFVEELVRLSCEATIICVSGYGRECHEAQEMEATGMVSDFLEKPFTREVLEQKVRAALAG